MDTGNSCEQTKYLFFYVGGGLYAVEVFKILGVCEITSLTHLVGARPYVIGITSLDDFIWPVVDLQMWLCGKKTNKNERGTFLAVAIDNGEQKFLAVIDAAVSMEDICDDMIAPANGVPKTSHIRVFISTGDMTAGLLSIEELFDT